ncbi:centrosome-associated protein CEP250 isoform X2 [Rhagoletis pomonella]|uniref:centrosome-associated protein CEP250 isoform X2 n=1 Tax=Rhagoletis pomonella TaxID=28610 RepID=UPI00177C1660|nr:centrosome-associated protein CEP250 isoform X2 [Rhagoletis pomonella]
MHHLYPSLKGDQLCPLGFHPQTRYPTRCKRCFRDYKEHGGRRGIEDVAVSSPNLTDGGNSRPSSRTWTSTQNLSSFNGTGSSNDIVVHFNVELKRRPQSWASTPDIDEAADQGKKDSARASGGRSQDNDVDVTVKLPVAPRRHTTALDIKEAENGSSKTTSSSSTPSPSRSSIPEELIILSSDSLAERVRKMNLLKKQRQSSRESSRERSVSKKSDDSDNNSSSDAESKAPPDRPERSKSSTSVAEAAAKRNSLPPKKVSTASSTAATTSTSTSTATASITPKAVSAQTTAATSNGTKTLSTSASAATKSTAATSTASTALKQQQKEEARRLKSAQDVEFMLKIKDSKFAQKRQTHDASSLTTETTETTLVGPNDRELQDELKRLRADYEAMKMRAERAERDKSDILLRRLASMDTASNRTAASEALALQQKVNEMKEQLEKVNEEKRRLNIRMKDIENNPKGNEYELKRKLQAAEQLCEELMEENQDAKKEILNLQAEMDELQDTYRDDDVKAKTNLQKDLEKMTKNCRILNFKLKKYERKVEIMEQEKQNGYNSDLLAKVAKLEEELRFSSELTRKLQAEAEELRNPGKRKTPLLGIIGKSTSADASPQPPLQLMRDLQDSVERESDLKDQLKFAEEEKQELLKKLSAKMGTNVGTQTMELTEVLCFPRATQTTRDFYQDAATETTPVLTNDASISVLVDTCENQTNTDAIETSEATTETGTLVYETREASTETVEVLTVKDVCEASTETELVTQIDATTETEGGENSIETHITVQNLKSYCDRECSPFATVFAAVAPRATPGLLFQSAISHALMASAGAATRKLSPIPHRLVPESAADRDEGISDEDDPAELRILLELNEQEASILRQRVDDLERENRETKKQVRELQDRVQQAEVGDKKPSSSSLLSFNSATTSAADKKLKALNEELMQLRKTLSDKDRTIERLQAETVAKIGAALPQDANIDAKRQLKLVEQEASVLRSKITTLESENEKLLKDNKRMQLQALRKSSSLDKNGTNGEELTKLKESLESMERERNELDGKLKRILLESEQKLPTRTPKRVTDLTPKNHLKKWVEELEDEIREMRVIVLNSGGDKLKMLETEKTALEEQLQKAKQRLNIAEGDIERLKTLTSSTPKLSELEHKLKKSDDEARKLSSKVKDLEDKIKKQDNQIKQVEAAKSALETQTKRDKEKQSALEKDYEKDRKEREKLESKLSQLEADLSSAKKAAEKAKAAHEKEMKELKTKSSKSDSKQVQELKKQLEDMQNQLADENRRYQDLNSHWEKLSEETILMRAQLTTEKNNMEVEISSLRQKLSEMDEIRVERTEMAKKLSEAKKKLQEAEAKQIKNGASEHEKTMLKNKLAEREQEYDRLRRENEMNIDLVFQLRKENEDLSGKLSDFNRIEQAQYSINEHSSSLQAEIKTLKTKLQNSELQLKSEVASTRLRYEQQVKNLSGELTSMQRQCEKFKKDRDSFKQLLESAQKKIGDLKASSTGRQSRGSMHSSDDDDKSKIAYLEQQIGCLEDQLVEARLEVSKVKTELVSERSANEIKISEMQSKLNEFEEERVIGSGRTKIPGMKTKLELSWQKEREDQQRLLQETSTLARDLRQTLFEVERERDKERLESKRRLDQLKRSTEEEMEEGRRKIAELQCDLLELRDVHAKLRTSNEKLRRERERYEKELVKRRMEQDGGERKVGALLQTVDELVKIAPDLKIASASSRSSSSSGNTLRPEQAGTARQRSRSPSPNSALNNMQITNVLARLAEASEELRKFQRLNEDENERTRMRRSNLRRAASQENDPHGSQSSVASAAGSTRNGARLTRTSPHNGSLIRKSLSLDHSIQKDQNIWRQDDGSVSSMQSIDSELGGMVRDGSFDSRLSGGSTQSDIPRGPRKKKKSLMGKLRSLTKSSRNSESEVSVQGSDSDISVASDMRASKKDLRGRLSGMFKRAGSTSRSESIERMASENRPVAVTVVGDADGPQPREPPPANAATAKPIRAAIKPPTPTTPLTKRRAAK